jgi:hypothetical protein
MDKKQLNHLISQLENYVECWKQFNHYITLARSKKFTDEDEHQFLEIKSVITQELEMVLSEIEQGAPSKDDVHTLIGGAPSIRYLSELPDGSIRGIENQWHKSYIAWQSILGQLKVAQRKLEGQSGWKSLFGGKK